MSAICVENRDMEMANEARREAYAARRRCQERNMSGTAISSLLKGESAEPSECDQGARRLVHHVQPQRCHFTCPQDFFGGPKGPGKVTSGTRRCKKNDGDSVGAMLTDEYALAACEFKRVNHERPCCLTNTCGVITPEAPHRSSVRMNAHNESMDAPYYEDNDPKPQRDPQPAAGRKHYKIPDSAFRVGRDPEEYASRQTRPESRSCKGGCTNRINRSVNVLTLAQANPDEVKEARPCSRQHWVAKYEAPNMPPARRPTIRRVCVPANEVHDVLCSKPHDQGAQRNESNTHHVRQGVQRCTFNIFAPAPEVAQPKSAPRVCNILNYYDPARDQRIEAPPTRAGAARNNKQTQEAPPPPRGRNSGMYRTKNSIDTCELVWP